MKTYLKENISLTIILLGVLIYFLHFIERDPSSPYERPIVSDAKGYYAYLPAIFIYQDMNYDFIEVTDNEYYAVGKDKHIFIDIDGHKVNKTFPGVALLYLPFFLIAHFLAMMLSLPADGYSNIYQYLFDFGQFFYAAIGLLLLAKSLVKLGFERKVAVVSIIILMLGTNLWFYTVYDQSVTHIYNFFLINLLIYLLCLFKEFTKSKHLIFASTVFAILLIVRPTGIISLFLVGMVFPDTSFWKLVMSRFTKFKVVMLSFLPGVIVLSIPLILWKVQCGDWIVYSYGEEGFDFTSPQIVNFLFSYAKGWFLYSPLVLIVIVYGCFTLFIYDKKGKKQMLFLTVFLSVSIYIFSSWWCWWYGFSFGQRPMVDFYFFVGFLIAIILRNVDHNFMKKISFGAITAVTIFFNILQSYQHHHGFFQWSKPNSEIYWDNFLRFKKQSKVYLEQDWELLNSHKFDFETPSKFIQGEVLPFNVSFSGDYVIASDEGHPFSCNLIVTDTNFRRSSHVVASFQVYAFAELTDTELIMEYRGEKSSYASYNFNEFIELKKWTSIQLQYEVDSISDTLVIYFWNKDSGQKAFYDDFKVEIYTNY